MTIDTTKYRVNIPYIQYILAEKTLKERYEFISILALTTGVPIIAVCVYVLELYGKDEYVEGLLNRLKQFYLVTNILT